MCVEISSFQVVVFDIDLFSIHLKLYSQRCVCVHACVCVCVCDVPMTSHQIFNAVVFYYIRCSMIRFCSDKHPLGV